MFVDSVDGKLSFNGGSEERDVENAIEDEGIAPLLSNA